MDKCTYCGKVWEEPIVTPNTYFICECGTLVDIGYGLPDMSATPEEILSQLDEMDKKKTMVRNLND